MVLGMRRRRCDEYEKTVFQWGFFISTVGEPFAAPYLTSLTTMTHNSQREELWVDRGCLLSVRHAWLDALSGACQTPRARGVR